MDDGASDRPLAVSDSSGSGTGGRGGRTPLQRRRVSGAGLRRVPDRAGPRTVAENGAFLLWLVVAMAALTAIGEFGIQPILAGLKAAAAPIDVMQSALRDRFATWHGIASGLYLLNCALGVVLVVLQNRAGGRARLGASAGLARGSGRGEARPGGRGRFGGRRATAIRPPRRAARCAGPRGRRPPCGARLRASCHGRRVRCLDLFPIEDGDLADLLHRALRQAPR